MCRLFLMTIACLMIVFGITGLWFMPKLIQQKIEERMQLKIGTKNFERFTNIPIPLTVKFYLFNVSNSEMVLQGLERPHFQEVGPFMYKQWRRREITDFLDNNRKLTYREYKTFYPIPIPSRQQNSSITQDNDANIQIHLTENGSHNSSSNNIKHGGNNMNVMQLDPSSVNVTIINVPLLSALTKIAQLTESGSLKRQLAAKAISRLIESGDEKILVTRPANQLLFDGYKVGLMEEANNLLSNTLGFNFESPLPKNKFGFFHGKNGTWSRKEAGEMTVFSGRNNSMDDFMIVDNWNGLKQLKVWPTNTVAGNRCNEIRGTDGSQFHPGVTRDQVLNIFSPMICSSIFIKYKEDTSCRNIPLLRFTTPPEVFAAPKKNPRNACYCTIQSPATNSAGNGENHAVNKATIAGSASGSLSVGGQPGSRNGQQQTSTTPGLSRHSRITDSRCYIDGLIDLSLCQRGAPIAASAPHFYNSDPLLAMASGLKPDGRLHETHIDIEPMTGAVMRAASRAQINAMVESAALDVIDSQLIGHMTPMVAPLFWLEESAEIDEKSSFEFKRQLLNNVEKSRRTCIILILAGILIALVVSVQYWYVTCYKFDAIVAKRRLAAREDEADAKLRRRRHRHERRAKFCNQSTVLPLATGADARKSYLATIKKTSSLDRDVESSTDDYYNDDDYDDNGEPKNEQDATASDTETSKLESPLRLSVSRNSGADFRRVQREKARSRRPDYTSDKDNDTKHDDKHVYDKSSGGNANPTLDPLIKRTSDGGGANDNHDDGDQPSDRRKLVDN